MKHDGGIRRAKRRVTSGVNHAPRAHQVLFCAGLHASLPTCFSLIVLTYTIVNDDDVRFITARKAEKWMVGKYEENRKRN